MSAFPFSLSLHTQRNLEFQTPYVPGCRRNLTSIVVRWLREFQGLIVISPKATVNFPDRLGRPNTGRHLRGVRSSVSPLHRQQVGASQAERAGGASSPLKTGLA